MAGTEQALAQLDETSNLEQLARGDERALTAFYRANVDAFFSFVYRRVDGCHEDAEQITQDTFLSAVSLAHSFNGTCTFFTWLCGIAKLRIIDFFRHRERQKRIPPDCLLTPDEATLQEFHSGACIEDDVLSRIDTARLVDEMLLSLSEDEREALLLHYVEGLTVEEVAALMKRTRRATQRFIMRARKSAAEAGAKWV